MGILTRPLLRPQQRFDLEDYNVALSALRADSHFYTQRVMADKSFILQGFTISQSFIGQPTADVTMTGATLINGDNTGDVSWWTAPASASPMTLPTGVGGLQSGRNYVELQVYAQNGTPLQRAFWDPSANSGVGTEFSQQVDTVTEMFVRVVINQTGFSVGDTTKIKLAIIDLDGSFNIRGIKDKRDLFYRLGKPDDIEAEWVWSSRTEPNTVLTFPVPSGTAFQVDEIVTFSSGATATVVIGGTNNIEVFDFSNNNSFPGDTITGGTSGATSTVQSLYERFTGADKDIKTIRDMFTALMNEIRTVKGTRFWYETGEAGSLATILSYVNSLIAPVSAGARFTWDGSALKLTDNKVTGQASSDPIAAIRIPGYGSEMILTREDGTGGSASISIPDQGVLFVVLPDSLGSNRDYSESGTGVTNFQVLDRADFVSTDKHFVLAYREGNVIVITGTGELQAGEEIPIGGGTSDDTLAYIGAPSVTAKNPQYTTTPSADLSNQFTTNDSLTQAASINAANINDIARGLLSPYSEPLTVVSGAPADSNEVTGPLSMGSVLTLPLNSRDSGSTKTYTVGMGNLVVFLGGILQTLGEDYLEIGSSGTQSSTIQILGTGVVRDVFDFLILTPSYFGTSASVQPLFLNYIIGQNAEQVPAGHIYNVGTDRLQVWRNGQAINKSASVGLAFTRYLEDSNNAINLGEDANPDEVFTFFNTTGTAPTVSLITGVTGTVLTIPTYTTGNGSLRVYKNGKLLSPNLTAPTALKYAETSTTSITLATAAVAPDVFKVYISGTAPAFREIQTGITGTSVTGISTYVMANKRLMVFKNGFLMYNSTVLGAAANRYQEASTTSITLSVAAISGDLFEFIYV